MLSTFALLTLGLVATPPSAADAVSRVGLGLTRLDCATCTLGLAQDAPTPPPVGAETPATGGDRRKELERKIEDLNWKLRNTDTNWPILSVVAAYAGYVIAPTFLVVGGMFVWIATMAGQAAGTFLTIGLASLVIGAAGVALIVIGVITGMAASSSAKAERESLIRERQQLEFELGELKKGGAVWKVTPTPQLVVARF